MRGAPFLLLTLSFLQPACALACKCIAPFPVCDAVAASDFVFIGKVESVEPVFLDPWNAARMAQIPVEEIARLQADRSPASIETLRNLYLKMLPGLADDYARQLRSATTHDQLEKVFNAVLSQGRRTHFSVRAVYRSPGDDPDASDKSSAEPEPKTLDVWTDSDDCGYSFQKGETYLVYADDDEETGRLETSACTRTRRVSDAGPDLAYMFFLENGGENNARLQGFVTSDPHQDAPQFPDNIRSPVSGLVLELKSGESARYTTSDEEGRFIFDGIPEGEYQASVFDQQFPREANLLAGPRKIAIEEKSCANAVFTVPPPDSR